MQQQNGTKADVTLNTQGYADETHKQDYLTEKKEIPNTPFTLVRIEDKYFVSLGQYRLTNTYKTDIEAIDELNTQYWHIIMKIIMITFDIVERKKDKMTATPYETESL